MSEVQFYGVGFPYNPIKELPGKLIVLEGTDGVGRSTQIELLRNWLETNGFAVSDTGLRRSPMTYPGLNAAKNGHTMGRQTMNLFYATDFADRLENQIIPALKAGFFVLSDRYFFSIMARDIVRGADPKWADKVYGFALKPDLVFYLKTDVPTLINRLVKGRGFDYWESGMDLRRTDNLYDNFCDYQGKLIEQFDKLSKKYGFIEVDATQSVNQVFDELRRKNSRFDHDGITYNANDLILKITGDIIINNNLPEVDERLTSVIHLAEACNYEREHTHQVTRLALQLFDELSSLHKLGSRERFWLQCASLLHDIGWIEGRKEHHKTALRIILKTPILPFDNKERLIIGSVARYHRRTLPDQKHDNFASLNPEEQQIVRILAAILRIGDGLDSLHQNRVIELNCKVTRQRVNVTCVVLNIIPNESLVTSEKGDLFEIVFQRKLIMTYKKWQHD